MTRPSDGEPKIRRPAQLVGRALRIVEDATHGLRQRLLARQLGRTAPPEHWTPATRDELGLSAADLRRHAAEVRRAS